MKSLKTLMLAVASLAGLGIAGSAFAQCADTNLSAWSSTLFNNSAALHVVATGLEASPSACKLSATLGANVATGQTNAAAIVIDTTPSNTAGGEPRYRARFYYNVDGLGSAATLDGTVQSTLMNVVGSATSQGFNQILRIFNRSNSSHQHVIRLAAACGANSLSADGLCRADIVNVPAGNHYVEVDIQTGASGSVTYWLDSNATSAAGTKITSNSGTTLDMSAWGGVTGMSMGISNTSPNYRLNYGTATLFFDAFDSRRQTAIGP